MIGLLTVGLIGNPFFLLALLAGPVGRLMAAHVPRQPQIEATIHSARGSSQTETQPSAPARSAACG